MPCWYFVKTKDCKANKWQAFIFLLFMLIESGMDWDLGMTAGYACFPGSKHVHIISV